MRAKSIKKKVSRKRFQGIGELRLRRSFGPARNSGIGLGKVNTAAIPPKSAAAAPSKNAGKLPPPKSSSHDPLPRDTTTCGITTARFNTPIDKPCPPPTFSVKVAVSAYGTEYVTASGTPRMAKMAREEMVTDLGGPSSTIAISSAAAVMSAVAAKLAAMIMLAKPHT
jgi:hypothetical protein